MKLDSWPGVTRVSWFSALNIKQESERLLLWKGKSFRPADHPHPCTREPGPHLSSDQPTQRKSGNPGLRHSTDWRTHLQAEARSLWVGITCYPFLFLIFGCTGSNCSISSVQFSHSVVSNSLQPYELQHARPPCPSQTPGVYPCPSSWWCHSAISSSVIPFSSCPQSLPASGSFPASQLFTWGGQSIGVSASTSVLPMNTQDWSPSGWTGWISLHSKGLSRVFSNTTIQKHQFFGTQLSSQSNSHIHTWPLEKP